jgi:radical SAM superfamily enzyme YgiQ (UPF0313 family)
MDIEKIVLMEPERDGRFLGKASGAPYTLMRLASMVPQDVPVEIWDENLGPFDFRRLGKRDLVGISAMTLTIERAEELARQARPHCGAIVVGGVHATLLPDEVSRWADAVVVGEGYRTWPRIVEDFASGTLAPRYVDVEWASLDDLTPISERVLKMVNEQRNYWTPYLEITRGCPRSCTFCTAVRVSGRKMRLRPIEQIVEEIQRRKIRRFFLTDDNFGLAFHTNPEYMEELFRALARLPLNAWTTQAEMSVCERPNLLELAREAHLDKFFIGFESVNEGNVKELGGKVKVKLDSYRQAIRTIHEHGIGVVGLFVFGFDADTPQVFADTLDFIWTSELDGVSLTVLTPFPATPFRQQLEEEGRLLTERTWHYYDTAHVTFRPKLMTVKELEEAYDWTCRKVYHPLRIAQRGLHNLSRYPLHQAHRKAFSSFSTDMGYRRAYGWRNAYI